MIRISILDLATEMGGHLSQTGGYLFGREPEREERRGRCRNGDNHTPRRACAAQADRQTSDRSGSGEDHPRHAKTGGDGCAIATLLSSNWV